MKALNVLSILLPVVASAGCGFDQAEGYPVHSDKNVTASKIEEGKLYFTENRVCVGIEGRKYCFANDIVQATSQKGSQSPAGILFEPPLGPLDDKCNDSRNVIDERILSFRGFIDGSPSRQSKSEVIAVVEAHFDKGLYKMDLVNFGELECTNSGRSRYKMTNDGDGYICRVQQKKFEFSDREYVSCAIDGIYPIATCEHLSVSGRGVLASGIQKKCLHKIDEVLELNRQIVEGSELSSHSS